MKVRYQADNDLRKSILRGTVRREPRIDFRSAQSARLDDVPDPEVLALAAREGRILISHVSKHAPPFRAIHTVATLSGSAVDTTRHVCGRRDR